MAIKKITKDEIKNNSIERLSNRPPAAGRIGVGGLSPAEIKAAYDKLPMLAIAKINELIDLINAETSSDGIAAFISTPITDPDNDEVKLTLHDVLTDVLNGDFAKYLALTDLKESTLEEELRHIEEKAISAYEIARKNGFEGTAEEWLDSLRGKDGKNAVYIGEGDLPDDYDMQLIPVGGAHAVIGKRWLLYITEDGKLDVIDLDSVINIDVSDDIEAALAAAKASGEFDGKSVSIVSKTESNEDGGINIVVFSEGTTLKVKNGSKGKTAYEYAKEGGFEGSEEDFAEQISREIPTKLSQLENDLEGIGAEKDPTVPAWAKQASKPSYSASEVGADPSGTAAGEVSEHNSSGSAHSDLRNLITGLTNRINAIANSTDTDLDQLAEIVAYIKSNKSLIDSITTSKVSVTDIINNLTSNVTNKPLSAAQGVVLKGLIDGLSSSKLDASKLAESITAALAEAKASGEFEGAAGERGHGILKVTTAPTSYTTSTGGKNPIKRMSLSTIKSQAEVDEVLVGDQISYSYYLYHVYYIDATYAYMDTYVSIRGAGGAPGTSVTVSSTTESEVSGGINTVTFSDGKSINIKNGKDGPTYTLNEADKAVIVRTVIETLGGNPVFGYVDEDSKTIVLKNAPDGEYTLAYIDDEGNVVGPIGTMDKDTNVYYSVFNNLTNCTNSNSATEIVEGGSYSATIIANDGYELKSLVVTMGGANVSVSGGNISIANVTGDIVITAVAEEATVEINNLAQPDANATGEAAWNSGGWCNNSYMAGSSYAYRSATDGRLTTNTIAVEHGDTIYVKGITYTTGSYPQLALLDSSGNRIYHSFVDTVLNNSYIKNLTATNGGDHWSFRVGGASDVGIRAIRLAGYPSGDISDIIITRNQPIV